MRCPRIGSDKVRLAEAYHAWSAFGIAANFHKRGVKNGQADTNAHSCFDWPWNSMGAVVKLSHVFFIWSIKKHKRNVMGWDSRSQIMLFVKLSINTGLNSMINHMGVWIFDLCAYRAVRDWYIFGSNVYNIFHDILYAHLKS